MGLTGGKAVRRGKDKFGERKSRKSWKKKRKPGNSLPGEKLKRLL